MRGLRRFSERLCSRLFPTNSLSIRSRFNGTFRAEGPDTLWFFDLKEAKHLIEAWRQEYNDSRPRPSLGDRTPSEFASERSYPCSHYNLNLTETNTVLGTGKLDLSPPRYTNNLPMKKIELSTPSWVVGRKFIQTAITVVGSAA